MAREKRKENGIKGIFGNNIHLINEQKRKLKKEKTSFSESIHRSQASRVVFDQ